MNNKGVKHRTGGWLVKWVSYHGSAQTSTAEHNEHQRSVQQPHCVIYSRVTTPTTYKPRPQTRLIILQLILCNWVVAIVAETVHVSNSS